MVLAQFVVPAALAFDELRRWRQKGPVQRRLLAQHIEKTHPGTGLGLVGLREVRAVDHAVPGRQQQAACAAHHQQALDPGALDRLDDGVGFEGREMRCTEHRIDACDRLLQGGTVLGIQCLGGYTFTPLQLRWVTGNGHHTVATAQGFFQQLAAGTAGGANDCDLAHRKCSCQLNAITTSFRPWRPSRRAPANSHRQARGSAVSSPQSTRRYPSPSPLRHRTRGCSPT